MALAAAAILSLPLFYSCRPEVISNNYQVVDDSKWDRNTEYHFSFMIDDTSAPYNVIIAVRHYNTFPFHNLWIFCREESPVGLIVRDTIECKITDKHGLWTGHGLSLRETSFPIRHMHYFPIRGQYSFDIRQGMRGEYVSGIREIGLRIEKL
jgi:gliding motility-associated lipoprotein GldH